MSCSPTMSHIAGCSCLIQTWLTGWSKRHRKDQNCCINIAGKVTTPSLCCTILTLESTVETRQTYKLLLYYVCRPEWGTVPQDMALIEQKPDLVVTYEPAKPTRILLVELTVPWQFCKERQQVMKDAGSLGATDPSGKNPLSGPKCGWLCWEVIIPWKCYQPYAMFSTISALNKELTSL